MNKTFVALLLFILATLKFEAQAQTFIGFDPSFVVNFTDTVHQNDTASFEVKIKNFGSVPADCVSVYSGYKDSTGNVSGIQQAQYYSGIANPTIPANNSFTRRVIINYSANRFPVGIDVVVIWPKSFNAGTIDSLEFSPVVLTPMAVNELLRKEGLLVFPNPFKDRVTIHSGNNPIETLSVYDLNGKLIYHRSAEETIDLSQIAEASYLLELRYKSGTRKFVKIVKQNK